MPKNIENLTIHAFRGLRELELRDLGRINLFVGPNNCGKTSVLEAIATFCRPLDIREWFGAARRREIKSTQWQPLYDAVQWMFPHANGRQGNGLFRGETRVSASGGSFAVSQAHACCEEIVTFDDGPATDETATENYGQSLSLSDRRHVTELRLSALLEPELAATYRTDLQTNHLQHDYSIRHDRPFTSRAPPDHPALPLVTVSPFAHRIEELQAAQLTALTLGDRKSALLDVLRMFDSEVSDAEILSPRGLLAAVYLTHERLGRAPLSAFGDGMRRALVIAMSLVSVEHGVLLIDEIEASIHTSVLESLFDWLSKACAEYDVQLFATTHSLEAVDAMLLGGKIDLNEVVGYHLEALPEKTAARRYSGELLRRLREERGLDVR